MTPGDRYEVPWLLEVLWVGGSYPLSSVRIKT